MSHQRKLFLVVHYGIHYHLLTGSRNSPTHTSEQPGAKHGLQKKRLSDHVSCELTESLSDHSRPLRPLACGEKVFIQNQHGSSPTKWDRSGTVVETLDSRSVQD